jgi:pimeloyl-ACP methyl ester carboxylesterase
MIIWRNAAAALASKVERLQEAERHLLEFVGRFDPVAAYEISPVETEIPHDVVPLSRHGCDVHPSKENDKTYRIHALRVTNQAKEDSVDKNLVETPLVFLHGYMNGAAYFYRNFAGLSRYFRSIYSVDLLGWGLSSRPNFRLLNDSVETTEDFFVESLEAWRRKNGVERMILAGHSMGGYLSVAYCGKLLEKDGSTTDALPYSSPLSCRTLPPARGAIDPHQSSGRHRRVS